MVRRPARLLKVLEDLFVVDVQLASSVRASGCRFCGGALHAAHYARKPRGMPAAAPAVLSRRHSFCCSREGCRRRTTPPSARFLGRRVWIAPWVLWVGLWSELTSSAAAELRRRSGFARRTWTRWTCYWRWDFPTTFTGRELQARFVSRPQLRQIWKLLPSRGLARSKWIALLRLIACPLG